MHTPSFFVLSGFKVCKIFVSGFHNPLLAATLHQGGFPAVCIFGGVSNNACVDQRSHLPVFRICLLYTSDAADE